MCMNGQPRLSALLLELLAEVGMAVWYAGDFDPEGLLIAQRLKRCYRGEFHFSYMSPEDYERSLSGETISPRRLAMLEKIMEEGLRGTAGALRRTGRAGYQENMLSAYEI